MNKANENQKLIELGKENQKGSLIKTKVGSSPCLKISRGASNKDIKLEVKANQQKQQQKGHLSVGDVEETTG